MLVQQIKSSALAYSGCRTQWYGPEVTSSWFSFVSTVSEMFFPMFRKTHKISGTHSTMTPAKTQRTPRGSGTNDQASHFG